MSDIDSSTKRLDAAVARLETAAGKRIELAAADRERLEQQLAALRDDVTRLRESSAGVSARLDAAIGRLKLVLEDDA